MTSPERACAKDDTIFSLSKKIIFCIYARVVAVWCFDTFIQEPLWVSAAGDMWGAHGTERSPTHLRLTFQWSLGGQLRKVVKDTNYKRARLMVACMTEKINSIEREKGMRGKAFGQVGRQRLNKTQATSFFEDPSIFNMNKCQTGL